MKQSKRILALILSLVLLASSMGCSYAILGCAAASCISSGTPDSIKQQVTESVKDVISEAAPELNGILDQVTQTPAPQAGRESEKDPGNAAANESFLALDRELFISYITSDSITLDQFCKEPASYGIDESTVPVTLGDFSEQANAETVAEYKTWLERLQKIDRSQLSEENAFAYDNYVRYFERSIAAEGLFYYYEPFEEVVGLQLDLPLTFGLYEFDDKHDVENYLTLLADVPRFFGQLLAFEQKRAEMGIFMTETMLDNVLADFDSVINSRETSYLLSTFPEALDSVDWLTDAERQTYYAQNEALVKGAFTDAYVTVRNGLEALRPYCREMVGARNLNADALRYFELELQDQSANSMSVDEAIAFLEEISTDFLYAYRAAYRKATKPNQETFTTGSIEGDERYLKTLILDIVPPMPEINVTYKEIPKELQEGFSPAAYLLPAYDNYTDNTILINPKDPCDLMTLAHEGYPGHMFQYTYQLSLGTVPLFLLVTEPIGYSEGWSTNAELSVAKRADMFGAANLLTQKYNTELTNVIVTIGCLLVNGKGYSRTQLLSYLTEWGMEAYTDELYEIAVNLPTYYFKYTMGFCQQYAITEKCRKIFSFQDRDFYREYLSWGPGYFDLLEPKMIAWAQQNAQ